MTPENLHTLLRLRRQAVDAASQEFAACLALEAAATTALREQASRIQEQRRIAEAVTNGDHDVEAFASWYRGARAELDTRIARHERALAETARARAAQILARTALETVETLQAEAHQAAVAASLRQEQHESDDAAGQGRIRRSPDKPPV